jgi:hypothetical protein
VSDRTCSEPDCEKAGPLTRGRCKTHYKAWRRSAGENFVSLNHDPVARFWEKVDKRDPDECWPWRAAIEPSGYPTYRATYQGVRFTKAHRFAYHITVGPVPDGLDLDHLCHTRDEDCRAGNECPHRRCCNPAHLEPVTERVNVLRGRSASADNARKMRCDHGHLLAGDNLRIEPDGSRRCRTCNRTNQRRYKQRKQNRAA